MGHYCRINVNELYLFIIGQILLINPAICFTECENGNKILAVYWRIGKSENVYVDYSKFIIVKLG